MSLAKKLNLKDEARLRVIGKPKDVDLGDVAITALANGKDVLVFVSTLADLDRLCAPVVDSALADRLAWAAYPKAGQLEKKGIQPVRQIAIDDVWSALRFRPR
ncbi:MAG: hypothetical protein ACXWLL_07355 [Myxococcaceae bacterium]